MLGHCTYYSSDGRHAMYMLNAPNSERFGALEPRSYLEVDPKTNYSDIIGVNGEVITTKFNKIRVTASRIRGKLVLAYKIDCSDFTFAEQTGESIHPLGASEDQGIYSISLYGVACTLG